MRQFPTGDPPPRGLSGTLENKRLAVLMAGIAGASAEALSLNPLGDMVPYGASLAGLDRQGGSNLGGQDNSPTDLPPESSATAIAAVRSLLTPASPPGSNMTGVPPGQGKTSNNMTTHGLSAHNPPNAPSNKKPPSCCTCTAKGDTGPGAVAAPPGRSSSPLPLPSPGPSPSPGPGPVD